MFREEKMKKELLTLIAQSVSFLDSHYPYTKEEEYLRVCDEIIVLFKKYAPDICYTCDFCGKVFISDYYTTKCPECLEKRCHYEKCVHCGNSIKVKGEGHQNNYCETCREKHRGREIIEDE